MHKASAIILAGLGAAALAGAAVAASRDTHTLNVSLPDGSVAHVEYVGDIAPKVRVTPGPLAPGFAPFGMFDRSMFDMDRQVEAVMRQVDAMTKQTLAVAPGLNVASFGNAPAGATSVTIVSTTKDGKTCTRATEVTAQGAGKPPKVDTKISGECGAVLTAPTTPGKPTA